MSLHDNGANLSRPPASKLESPSRAATLRSCRLASRRGRYEVEDPLSLALGSAAPIYGSRRAFCRAEPPRRPRGRPRFSAATPPKLLPLTGNGFKLKPSAPASHFAEAHGTRSHPRRQAVQIGATVSTSNALPMYLPLPSSAGPAPFARTLSGLERPQIVPGRCGKRQRCFALAEPHSR